MWLGTMPSGESAIVGLRRNLAKLLFGPGSFSEFMSGNPMVIPSVSHAADLVPSADIICVYCCSDVSSISPWSCPLPSGSFSTVEAWKLINTRADADGWLARLSAKTLLCRCRLPPHECWAWMLRLAFIEEWGTGPDDDGPYTFDVADEDTWFADDHPPEVFVTMSGTDLSSNEKTASVPQHVPWPEAWRTLVRTIRGLQGPVFWEIFCGAAVLTTAFQGIGIQCAPPLDVARNADFNLLNAFFVAVIVGLINSHLIDLLHIAPPCATFSIILNGFAQSRLRSLQFPDGLPDLDPTKSHRVRVGNALAEVAAVLMIAQCKAANLCELEQPGRSLMEHASAMKDALAKTGARGYQRNACADGAPWMKPIVLFTPSADVGRSLVAGCPGCQSHIRLKGVDENGDDWTKVASPYWPAWAEAVARKWRSKLLRHRRSEKWEASAPMLLDPGGCSQREALEVSNFTPSGGRSIEKAADVMGSGMQPTRKALPQLVPDGLPPHFHLRAALATKHPLAFEPRSTGPVQYALKYAVDNEATMEESRSLVAQVLRKLAVACSRDNEHLLSLCEPSVKQVLVAFGVKNVALMREISFSCGSRDIASPGYLLLGLPMVGWTPAAEGLMDRVRPPERPLKDFLDERVERNMKMISSIKPGGDTALEELSYEKTIAEVERGVLVGPFQSLNDVPLVDPAVIPRHGIWEKHGGATMATVRNIDDMLKGGHNATVGTVSSHRPTDPDALVAQVRAVRRRYPQSKLQGWPCDLKSAYKQVPGDPTLLNLAVIAVLAPASGSAEFFMALCQLFGGKSPPVNFARFAAWLCDVNAVLFAVPASHCVDDIISVEPSGLARSGNLCFKLLCLLTSWELSPEKAPPPDARFLVIGVTLDLSDVPEGEAILLISEARIKLLEEIILDMDTRGRLGPGEAASLTGKLGFTLCACSGRYGRAKLRPYIRRCGENRVALNRQIRAANAFWLQLLHSYVPRPIPVWLDDMPTVVSYSDGEGSDAGLGIAVWSPRSPLGPQAAFCKIPDAIRRLWSRRQGNEMNDIYLIEAIGPLSILLTFPNLVRNSLWIHFIDNEAAQYALVRGSSSINAGDVVVGETWRKIQALRTFAYFDRVESKANPVDGLSRGRWEGPWQRIIRAKLPTNLEELLRADLEASESDID